MDVFRKAINKRFFKALFMEARLLPVLVWSWSAVLLASGLVLAETGTLNYLYLVICVVMVCFFQAYPVHAANEILDWETGVDKHEKSFGGSKVLKYGLLTPKQMNLLYKSSLIVFIIAGLIISLLVNIWLIVFGAIGSLTGILYSAKLKLAYRPFVGEWLTGFLGIFIAITGTYYFQTFSVSLMSILLGIYYGLHCISIQLVFHSIDLEADKVSGKITSLVYLGYEKSQQYIKVILVLEVATALSFFLVVPLSNGPLILGSWFLLINACIILITFWKIPFSRPFTIIGKTKSVTYMSLLFVAIYFSLFDNYAFWTLIIPVIVYLLHKKYGKIKRS